MNILVAAMLLSAPQADWEKVLLAESAALPKPLDKVEWRDKLDLAFKEAEFSGRPLFVTMRCIPCKQCSAFDKDVLEGGPELSPLLRQFVTVRITNAEHIDERIFPYRGFQDLDLSWWGYFLSPDRRIYGIFGGRDEVSDATRISVEALANTMRRVLAHHYHPDREKWALDGPTPAERKGAKWPFDLPGWKSYQKTYMPPKQGCLHCHQIQDILRQDPLDRGAFDKRKDLDMWPLPENVGIRVDRDHGLRVTDVEAGSPAAGAGIRKGDVLGAAGGRRLFSQADFRGVLHRGPKGAGSIDVVWLRDGKVKEGTLKVKEGWRATVMDWRMTVSQGNVGAGPAFFPIRGPKVDGRETAKPFIGKKRGGPAWDAGVRPHHVIVAVDGEPVNRYGRAFLVWFRLNHEAGDKVTLTVLDNGKRRDISYTLGGGRE